MVPKSATGLEVLALLIQWLHVLGFEGGGRDKKREFIQFASERKKLNYVRRKITLTVTVFFSLIASDFPQFVGEFVLRSDFLVPLGTIVFLSAAF